MLLDCEYFLRVAMEWAALLGNRRGIDPRWAVVREAAFLHLLLKAGKLRAVRARLKALGAPAAYDTEDPEVSALLATAGEVFGRPGHESRRSA
jgi:hypothetical protein